MRFGKDINRLWRTGSFFSIMLFSILLMAGSLKAREESDYLFNDSIIYEYRLYFWQDDFWDSLTYNFGMLDNVYMPCDLLFEDSIYYNVGVRFKGYSSYFSYPGPKKSFKLDFNRFIDSQEFYGLKKINLNNGFKDPTFMREKTLLDVADRFVPCSRSAYARLYINDEYWGLYIVVEQVDKTFIQSRFGEDENGNLFKGDPNGELCWYGPDQENYYSFYSLKTNEIENDWSDLVNFIDILNHTPSENLVMELSKQLDVRNYITFQVLNNMFVNLDSYYGVGHNYYLYHTEYSDRFLHIPWDLNESFGNFTYDMPPDSIFNHSLFWQHQPPESRPLVERVLADSYFRELYLNLTDYLMDTLFTEEYLFQGIDFYHTLIRTAVYEDTLKMFTNIEFERNFDNMVDSPIGYVLGLREFIAQRRVSITKQLESWNRTSRLFINEFMATNDTTIADETGAYEDWIEIYNDNLFPVDLNGCFLTDDYAQPDQWAFPDTTIEAGGFILIWADNDPADGPLHTNFKLKASGESIALVNPNLEIIDSITFGEQVTDISYGRFPDGIGTWRFLTITTPEAPNAVPCNTLPEYHRTTFTPNPVSSADMVLVMTEVTDESAINEVNLYYNTGSGYEMITMYDDGFHNDYSATDTVFGAGIPAQPDSTVVRFYIETVDDSGGIAFNPPNPNMSTYWYKIGNLPVRLFINEFMASNDTTIADDMGDFDDWIELYNGSDTAINPVGMYLTDDLENPTKFLIGDTILPVGEFMIFWADDEPEQGLTHTNFKLGSSGEQIGLFNTDWQGNQPIDTFTFGHQTTDISVGYFPDGDIFQTSYSVPTPGESNFSFTCGDMNNDESIDIIDILNLINHIYHDGPPPDPIYTGDVNSDGQINILDILYLINFKYRDGPDLYCP